VHWQHGTSSFISGVIVVVVGGALPVAQFRTPPIGFSLVLSGHS
jgi:hypothetical protein